MSIDATFITAVLTGLFGAVVVTAIGARCTPNRWFNGAAGAFFGVALGVITHVLWRWSTRGIDPLQIWMLPAAAVTLLLVMSAQNWFVFYEDGQDAFESAKPTLVLLAAALASVIASLFAGRHLVFIPMLWAGMGSWAILLSLQPIQRSIEINRSVLVGSLVGLCKIVLPLTGFIVFIPMGIASRASREPSIKTSNTAPSTNASAAETSAVNPSAADSSAPAAPPQYSFWTNLVSLPWELMLLLAMTMTNGGRVPPRPAASHPLEYLSQRKHGESVGGEMPRLRRDLAVLVLVLALHILCGLAIVRA
jgi:hypothetical protein